MTPKRQPRWAAVIVASTATVLTGIVAAAPEPAHDQQVEGPGPGTDEKAEEVLKRMAKRLVNSKTVKVKAVRELDAALVRQTNMPERATLDVRVMRPNHIRARSVAANDARVFFADGARATILDEKMNVYATVPAVGSIDDVSRGLEQRFGFVPPLGELLANDVEGAIGARARSMTLEGNHDVNGHKCHKLLLRGDAADAELYVSTKDDLPRRLVVTFKDGAASPRLRMSFTDWQLDTPVDLAEFAFTPPKGATEIEMVPLTALSKPGTSQAPAKTRATRQGETPKKTERRRP